MNIINNIKKHTHRKESTNKKRKTNKQQVDFFQFLLYDCFSCFLVFWFLFFLLALVLIYVLCFKQTLLSLCCWTLKFTMYDMSYDPQRPQRPVLDNERNNGE